MKREIRIGTSGWMYKHWNKTFYAEAGKENQLAFYSNEFNTVELNYSFYRMPDPKAYVSWYDRTPNDFMFTVKMNRYLTHLKRLIIDEESKSSLESFLTDTQGLKNKLGTILIQLAPGFIINLKRLNEFLTTYSEILKSLRYKPGTSIEFRNDTWFIQATYDILEKHKVALVFPSTPEYRKLEFTSNFAFLRIHGDKSYSDDELNDLKNEIDQYPERIKQVFVYFNNDANTYAIYNARYLKSLFQKS